jgi:hypothetical protein
MVRTVKATAARTTPPPGKGDRAVLLPGATGAEPWEIWVFGAKMGTQCLRTCSSPIENKLRKNTVLAFPVSQVFCLPLWLNETDPAQFAGMIPLQLELHGLQARGNHPMIFDWSVVRREGTRTLVLVGILPDSFPEDMHVEAYDEFDLSARYFSFPENALTLWRERDRLVMAITDGQNLVYHQALTEGQITPRILQDLNCIQATLAMQGVTPGWQRIMLWTPVSPEELTLLRTSQTLPINQGGKPVPQRPAQPWKLIPAEVGEARRAREIRLWRNRGLWIALAVYLLVVIGLGTRYSITSSRVATLHQWSAEHAQALALVHDTRSAWKELSPVVDKTSYPLELLLHAAEVLPANQLHLTLFEDTDGHLLIKGEAQNVSAAFQFLEALKHDPHFTGYTWDMGQPHLLPNDLAQLQIEGTRAH